LNKLLSDNYLITVALKSCVHWEGEGIIVCTCHEGICGVEL